MGVKLHIAQPEKLAELICADTQHPNVVSSMRAESLKSFVDRLNATKDRLQKRKADTTAHQSTDPKVNFKSEFILFNFLRNFSLLSFLFDFTFQRW